MLLFHDKFAQNINPIMKNLIITSCLLLFIIIGKSQDKNPQALVLDFNIFDLPAQINSAKINGDFIRAYEKPSMNQALTFSTNFYSSFHFGINEGLHFYIRNIKL